MSTVSKNRRSGRSAAAVVSAIGAVALLAECSNALTINQWTGDAGTSTWGTAGNWLEGNVPNSGDQAVAYSGSLDLNSSPASVGGVLLGRISSTPTLDTNGYELNVLGTTGVDGGVLYAASAPSGGFSVQSPTVNLTDGGLLDMLTGTAHVRVSSTASGTPNGTISVDGTSTVLTEGTLDTGTFTNNGQIQADAASAINATTFTLAGSSSNLAVISAAGNSLTINATTFELNNYNAQINLSTADSSVSLQGSPDYSSGNIGATVNIGDTSTLTLGVGAWEFGYYTQSGATVTARGIVNLEGGPTLARAAQVAGYAAYFSDVNVSGYGNLPAAEFDGGADVSVASSSYLYLNGPYFRGTSTNSTITFNGPGQIEMNGATQIGYSASGVPYTSVAINAGTIFDWDGTSESAASCSITNGELDIYTSTIDVQTFFHGVPLGPYGYQGTINITGGAKLNVAGTAWNMYGVMNLSPGAIVAGQTMTLDGSYLPAGTYSLYPSYSGSTFPVIQAPVVLNPNTYIYMGFEGGLHLDGATTWAGGGVISAPFVVGNPPYGILAQDGNATVSANTNIFCDVLDMDGTSNTATWTIDQGVTLTQQAFYLDAAGSTTNPFHSTITINGGVLDMQTSSGVWTLVGGTINMNTSGSNSAVVEGEKLILGSGASIGTIKMGASATGFISVLQSGATSVAGGNILDAAGGSLLVVGAFGSDANAVLTKTGPGRVAIESAQDHSAGSQIIVSQGELDMYTDAGAGGANLALNSSGGLTNLYYTQRLASLTVGSGAMVTAIQEPSASVIVATLNMSGGTLDLTNNDMICHNGNLQTVSQDIQIGYSNGTWTGIGGITSSAAATDAKHLHALGAILNNGAGNQPIYSTFEGQPAVTTDVLIKYTYYGDANLDGKVDASDYSRIDNGYLSHLTGWYNGDFNYDGVVNGSDYTLIDNAFNMQGAQISASVASAAEIDTAPAATAVPEPLGLGFVAAGAAGLLGRRRWVSRG